VTDISATMAIVRSQQSYRVSVQLTERHAASLSVCKLAQI